MKLKANLCICCPGSCSAVVKKGREIHPPPARPHGPASGNLWGEEMRGDVESGNRQAGHPLCCQGIPSTAHCRVADIWKECALILYTGCGWSLV